MENPYIKTIEILDLAFDHFNEVLCNGSLKKPIINILSRGTKKCLGWHWKDKWKLNEESVTEITIVAERLDRSLEEILETLLHEMVHLYNSQAGLKDCNAQQRHNKHFKKTAQEIFFLQVDKHPTRAWALTSLTDRSRGLIETWLQEKQIFKPDLVRVAPKAKEGISKQSYMISVTAEDYQFIKQKASEEGLSYKEVISELLSSLKEEKNEEKVA